MTCQLDIGPNECVSCYNHGISSCNNKLVAFLNNISLTLTNNTNHVLLVTKKTFCHHTIHWKHFTKTSICVEYPTKKNNSMMFPPRHFPWQVTKLDVYK